MDVGPSSTPPVWILAQHPVRILVQYSSRQCGYWSNIHPPVGIMVQHPPLHCRYWPNIHPSNSVDIGLRSSPPILCGCWPNIHRSNIGPKSTPPGWIFAQYPGIDIGPHWRDRYWTSIFIGGMDVGQTSLQCPGVNFELRGS